MIICQKCAKEKDNSEYYGIMKICKECHKKAVHANHVRRREYIALKKKEIKTYPHPVRNGDKFFAKIRKHDHSKNMLGQREFAGQIIGEFVCDNACRTVIHAGGRQFRVEMFKFEVITE